MTEYYRREHYGQNLTRGHNQTKNQRSKFLNSYKNEYLSNRACQRQQKHMIPNIRVLGQEFHRLRQLVLAYQTHQREQTRVNVCYEHKRYARHRIVFNQAILPSARKTIADQVPQ